jgi:hypothetical protein
MRFVPLISSKMDPLHWRAQGTVALRWEGDCPDWTQAVRQGAVISAVDLPGQDVLAEALAALGARLNPDFLLLPVALPMGREAEFRLLGLLESLLEATSGRGVKLALKLAPGSESTILALMKQARAEAVGFCWHPGTVDPEPLADRLWFGLCEPGSDLRGLQKLGYRWDMALAAEDPLLFSHQAASLAATHPEVLFPEIIPITALGRPVLPDDSVIFGNAWPQEGGRP